MTHSRSQLCKAARAGEPRIFLRLVLVITESKRRNIYRKGKRLRKSIEKLKKYIEVIDGWGQTKIFCFSTLSKKRKKYNVRFRVRHQKKRNERIAWVARLSAMQCLMVFVAAGSAASVHGAARLTPGERSGGWLPAPLLDGPFSAATKASVCRILSGPEVRTHCTN